MGNARLSREGAHSIYLVLHQRNKGRDDDSYTIHNERGELVAKRLATARRHKYKGILALENVVYYSLLIAFE